MCVRPGLRQEAPVGWSSGGSGVGCQCALSWCDVDKAILCVVHQGDLADS